MVSAQEYLPEAGDLVWLDFTPQAGREQAGRRPALVLSPRAYNAKTSLAIVCPITSHVKGYPFEVALPSGGKIGGVILSDHVKNLDWRQRRAIKAGKVQAAVLRAVRERLAALLEII
jgi:mRNA interferase MazF